MDQQRRPRRPEASGVLGIQLRRLRTIPRICLLTFGMPYIYSALGKIAVFEWVVRIAVFPFSVATRIAMWQQAKVRTLLAKTGLKK
jgi:hypothetical protein